MQKVWLNEVEAYGGLAAVDAYLGATELSLDKGMEYGGGHVIEDLVSGREVSVRASSYGTDCYPSRKLETTITLEDLNQAYLFNPRNVYQRYNAAVNTSERKLRTYMGTLLPNSGNINYAGTGEISPLLNDPTYQTIGFGTKIFLAGAEGKVVGEGTQHSPQTGFGNIAVKGELRQMSPKYIRGATIPEYGTSLMVGIGIPIPILNEELAKSTAVRNDDIQTNLLDYGIARRDRPTLRAVKYSELMSGHVELNGKSVKTAPLSSIKIATQIMDELGRWFSEKRFQFAMGSESLPVQRVFKPMKVRKRTPLVAEIMTRKVHTARVGATMEQVSRLMVEKGVDQIPIVDANDRLQGIVTSFNFTKAVADNKWELSDMMTHKVITSRPTDAIDEVSRRLERYGFNSTPVIDADGRLVGIITVSDINRAWGRLKK
jgi:uncharacterized protein (DUF39 family)/predicted transcriptional regulator